MLPYAKNGQFKVYGFSGVPFYIGKKELSGCWNLNGQDEPYCNGTANVLEVYHKAI
jgi:hypothetical protein